MERSGVAVCDIACQGDFGSGMNLAHGLSGLVEDGDRGEFVSGDCAIRSHQYSGGAVFLQPGAGIEIAFSWEETPEVNDDRQTAEPFDPNELHPYPAARNNPSADCRIFALSRDG